MQQQAPKAYVHDFPLDELAELHPEQLGELFEFLSFRWCEIGLRDPDTAFAYREVSEAYALRLISHFSLALSRWHDLGLVSADNLAHYLRPVVELGLWKALHQDVRMRLDRAGVNPRTVPVKRRSRPSPEPVVEDTPEPAPEPPVLERKVDVKGQRSRARRVRR